MRWWPTILLLAVSVPALGQDGGGTLAGFSKIKVKKCDSQKPPTTWNLQLSGNAWSTGVGGLSGAASPQGTKGQAWSLAFDGPSKLAFDQFIADVGTTLCGTPVTLMQPSTVGRFDLKLGKRGTQAKLRLAATATGTTAFGSGAGSLKMSLKGAWQSAP
jgi:hypothetical protein